MLYLVPTPIGNLKDITLRALEILNAVDAILCEDTRHSSILLNHYQISKPLYSYHKFNESQRTQQLLEELKVGKSYALITDGGTPCISDPGYHIVAECHSAGIPVIALPGPCAAVTALSASGVMTDSFQFVGFLPKKEMELKKALLAILLYEGTTICYESPHRVLETLEAIASLSPTTLIAVARELTKIHEEIKRLTALEQLHYWRSKESIKGEFVLLISGKNISQSQVWESLSPMEHVRYLEDSYAISRKEAIKLAAEMRGVPKRTIYQQTL